MSMESVTARVEEILARLPEARNDDKLLMRAYFREYHGFELPEEFFAPGVPSMETMRRARQFIQQVGKYPPTDATAARRRGREVQFREAFKVDGDRTAG